MKQMTDEEIISLYFERNETAIDITRINYEGYCMTVARNILTSHEDCEECVSDTWFCAWNAIPPKKPLALRIFLGKITRNLSINKYKSNVAIKRGGGETALAVEELEESIPASSTVEVEIDKKELTRAINSFLKSVSDRERDIFIRRYWYVDDIKTISQRWNTSSTNTKMILMRTRKKLKQYLEREGF